MVEKPQNEPQPVPEVPNDPSASIGAVPDPERQEGVQRTALNYEIEELKRKRTALTEVILRGEADTVTREELDGVMAALEEAQNEQSYTTYDTSANPEDK